MKNFNNCASSLNFEQKFNSVKFNKIFPQDFDIQKKYLLISKPVHVCSNAQLVCNHDLTYKG
jgi:hypothetical protein